MLIDTFYKVIIKILDNSQAQDTLFAVTNFLDLLNGIKNDTTNNILKITRMTVLFEGFYQSLPEDSELKKHLLIIRIQRWNNNLGTPSVLFLLTYLSAIKTISQQFKLMIEDKNVDFTIVSSIASTLRLCEIQHAVSDTDNNIVVDQKAMTNVAMPQSEEKAMVFMKTHNPVGGYTLPPDPYSQKFIEYAAKETKTNGKALEIGAAFGTSTLRALSRNAKIDCNDIDPQNLAVVRNRYRVMMRSNSTLTKDRLTLIPGSFPEELSGLPSQSYKAILACRVLHFFPGSKIDRSVKRMADLLEPGGKLYIVCETPFQKNWLKFLPEYEKRAAAGDEWPSEIKDSSQFENTKRVTGLPKFMHQLTTRELKRSVVRAGNLDVEECSYISRKGQFSDDALLDGRESVGIIAVRRITSKL